MPLPTYRATVSTQTSGGWVGVATPTGTVEGDLLLLVVEAFSATNWEASDGWSRLFGVTGQSQYANLGVFWRIATASEPANHYFKFNSSYQSIHLIAINGADTLEPFHNWATKTDQAAGTNCTAPSLTTTEPDCLIFNCFGMGSSSSGNRTFTPPAGVTELADTQSSFGAAASMTAASNQASAGTIPERTAVCSANSNPVTATLAIRPPKTRPADPAEVPTVRGWTKGSSLASNAAVSVARPTYQAGDILVAAFASWAQLGTPSGWTRFAQYQDTTSSNEVWVSLYWRLATASEPTEYSFPIVGGSSGTFWAGGILSLQNAKPSAPINVVAIGDSAAAASSGPHTAPVITPTVNNTRIFHIFGGVVGTSQRIQFWQPHGYRERFEAPGGADVAYETLQVVDYVQTTAAATSYPAQYCGWGMAGVSASFAVEYGTSTVNYSEDQDQHVLVQTEGSDTQSMQEGSGSGQEVVVLVQTEDGSTVSYAPDESLVTTILVHAETEGETFTRLEGDGEVPILVHIEVEEIVSGSDDTTHTILVITEAGPDGFSRALRIGYEAVNVRNVQPYTSIARR